ncbi:hypothetical protein HPB50_014636 [Hyalomma asiaticum]|uniref:Uncharacterized protein n=1 Tax=Hyalomma asiaticum TaxID=266040 RepID=A0ACB7RNP5_HYAAI|nr:hypothetical protein HPB50_014636 [Hyalomma asiaticum]
MLWRSAPITFPPGLPPLHARSAQVSPCHAGSGWLRKRALPCGSLDRFLERDWPLDWDRRRLLDRDLGRPSEEALSFLPGERLLDRDLDLERLFGRCDESRPACQASAERLLEQERVYVDWIGLALGDINLWNEPLARRMRSSLIGADLILLDSQCKTTHPQTTSSPASSGAIPAATAIARRSLAEPVC